MVKILDRLLLFIYSLVIGIATFFVLFMALKVIRYNEAHEIINVMYQNTSVRYTYIIATSILILISIRFFYISLRRSHANTPSIDQKTDFGDIRISLETVENLSLKAAARVKEVKDLKARIRVSDAGLEIAIRTIVDGESSIPHLTEEVQRTVKDHIEEITGIPVALVSVFVANITPSHSFKSRVE